MTVTTFSFTTGATVSSWTVPNHTGLVTITAIGGGGGTSVGYAVGGNGARLAGTCTLTPGTVLTIIEGGHGGDSWNEPGGARRGGAGGGATGWKGGNGGDGTGSWIIPNGWQAGGGGGGASAVDTPGGVLIVAGGGGGGGNSGFGSGDIGYAAGVGTLVVSGHVGATGGTRGGGGGGGMLGGTPRSGGSNFVDTARMTSIAHPGFGAAGVTITLDYTGPWVPPPPAGWSVGFLKF